MKSTIFSSEKLIFRYWSDSDKQPFAEMNSDLEVMKFFPKILNREESDIFFQSIKNKLEENTFGLWAVETKLDHNFIGFIGFNRATFKSDFTPCIEIGWRLKKSTWGKGYATEGALRCLEYGFEVFNFSEIFSFTAKLNSNSENVMKKIGMLTVREFIHPIIEDGNPLQVHVLYSISKSKK